MIYMIKCEKTTRFILTHRIMRQDKTHPSIQHKHSYICLSM